ncbi:DUF3311 domain-containing protein [Saccharolobus solfataricus]|uniref:DUF3311 domain-containing protein n=2 Tax=Saccharolobus solfataricus TaxID=2287 RepID=A0A0E3GUE0_SACSO|nr:DUF3311 domain-containing protein [Saccharolobus solfataricus]AKA72707.1 DUF3311 domain-containing protein [Saccharolobus solfataricus]AKA75406.1 DUF3311 domain-containing protein [Saccharolobus solfataricus]AKA78098.1 DUF3311 domain-containing protein [Saccharolobus solfataricus]AZF67220.1 DUF3311 domain-containing protein [Saccharolobus solfataricus]AZF69840.1 DUF3311 domain-containing protein [Saccharolobus solfataricus]
MVSGKNIIAGILLIIPFIAYFAIPTYNKVEPDLGGLPFFYWYQTLWLALSTILFSIAALILTRR